MADFELGRYDHVTVTTMKHVVEVQYLKKKNTKQHIQKRNAKEYVDLSTGEIKEFNLSDTRKDNINSLRKTFKKMRYLINANFEGSKNELFVTLTYREYFRETDRLYDDFRKFMQRLKYAYRKQTLIDYIAVPEPCETGRWHWHVLLRFNDLETIYIANEFDSAKKPVNAPLYDMWGHGFVTIHSLNHVDNIGAYVTAYLTDIEVNDENFGRLLERFIEKNDGEFSLTKFKREAERMEVVEKQGKKYLKGGRLHFYPVQMKLIRKSKGILYPERENMLYVDIEKVVGSVKPHYSKTYEVDNGDFTNTVHYEQYNLKRF